MTEKPHDHDRSPEWPKVREKFLEICPACAACGSTDGLEVHHIQPFHLHRELELDPSNLITLGESDGHPCHFMFGHLLDWRSYNPQVQKDAERYLEEVKARPKPEEQPLAEIT